MHRLRTIFRKKAMILVYHRVAEADVDPWALNVSPANFAQQLAVLKTIGDPISLQQLAAAKSDSDLPARPVCVTFDDGYADNLLAAKPALVRFGVPGTVFVTPGYLGVRDNLWWDELTKLVLDPASRKQEISFELRGSRYAYSFMGEPDGPDVHMKWRAWDAIPGPRQAAYLAIHTLLSPLPDDAREEVMQQIREGAAPYAGRQQHRCLTAEELRELAEGDLVEIGAHTLTHPVLSSLSAERQEEEIAGSKRWLESLTGKTITSFAYPYGKKNHYTAQTVSTVQAQGFACACSNFGGLVTKISNRFALPRFQPMDWDGDQFANAVAGWYQE
jgi:peptidoglycan/xylan/chitin deacetylase (PgdA/CDA1 family)